MATDAARQLWEAINHNDLERLKEMMTRDPDLHRAPLGYGEDGPLTWVAECRVPWETPGKERLAMAEWMLEHGSDVHQGGDGPLMRAALNAYRIPMMELLVAHGADVNALWHGHFPIIFASCESMDPLALRWLLEHGANPNLCDPRQSAAGQMFPGTAMDYLLATYARSPHRLSACIEVLLAAGGGTRYDLPGVIPLLRRDSDGLTAMIEDDPSLLERRYPELDFGMSGGRRLALAGATLLHVAAEFGYEPEAALLLDRGAGVNARATVDSVGVGGQTAIFHAVSQFDDAGLPLARLLVARGADLSIRVKLPGDYDQPGEVVEATPLGYALRFGGDAERETVAFLREHGAPA